MTLNTISFINEKDNVSVKIRNGIKPQILDKVLAALNEADLSAEKNANGGISFPVAIDKKTNETVYAHLDLTLNITDPMIKRERKKAEKKAEAVEDEVVPQIFG
jgi:DNA-binding IscR family transcriptional regulator